MYFWSKVEGVKHMTEYSQKWVCGVRGILKQNQAVLYTGIYNNNINNNNNNNNNKKQTTITTKNQAYLLEFFSIFVM